VYSEKAMEDQIAQAPEELLGEAGLRLIGRQVRFGQYIFDLLFEDRHGAKLIVELQRGTLDRQHMYKVLDYYDAFKDSNPTQFVDVMIVANDIPAERKRRLHNRGIAFREIPEGWFAIPAAQQVHGKMPSDAQGSAPVERHSPEAAKPATGDHPLLTPQMRHHAVTKARDHFGFAGLRAAMACLYARPEGATQAEVNAAARDLGSRQTDYYNMLRQGQKWNHNVVTWDDPIRGGKVFKLIYNHNHSGPQGAGPPANWRDINAPNAPKGVDPSPYPMRRMRKG
jgi:hypothetical protein